MQIYCRSIREDGYGEGVVPEMNLELMESMYGDVSTEWSNHLARIPVLYLIHPDLHKGKVGWVGGHKEQYEVYDHWQRESWIKVSKETYDIAPDDSRRIVLVPVEGKDFDVCGITCGCTGPHECRFPDKAEGKPSPPTGRVYNGWNENKSRVAGIGGQPGPFQRKAEEKEVVSKTPEFGGIEPEDYGSPEYAADTYAMGEFNSHHFPQQYMIARNGYLAGLKAKPTPVTCEAVDYFSTWLKSEVATLSREVSMSKAMNGMFDKIHLQILHKRLTEVLDKYQLFKQQTTKP